MQSFKEEPAYTEVNPGDNTELRCVVHDIGGECRWQKDGKVWLSFVLYDDLMKTFLYINNIYGHSNYFLIYGLNIILE
jgi:hypothetical protein